MTLLDIYEQTRQLSRAYRDERVSCIIGHLDFPSGEAAEVAKDNPAAMELKDAKGRHYYSFGFVRVYPVVNVRGLIIGTEKSIELMLDGFYGDE